MRSSRGFPSASAFALLAAVAGAQEPPPSPAPAPATSAGKQPEQSPLERPRPADAKALFAAMARMQGLEASFTEEKHLALLARPLTSRGKLYFLRPGYLARIVEAPEPSTLTITPEQLVMKDRDGTEVIDLKRSDKVRIFVTALVQVFAGNEPQLAKSFEVRYELDPKSERAWKLTLTPRGKPLDQLMKSLVMHGEGEALVRIEMHDPTGDRTVTRIVAADPLRTFDDAERKRWFGIEPK